MDRNTSLVIGLAFVVFAAVVGVRWCLGEKYQVTLTDLIVLVAPILIWLIVTNKIGEFTVGTGGLTLKAAANQPVRAQLSRISVQEVNIAGKESIDKIPALITQKIQALKLQINSNNYYDESILQIYLDQLTKYSFFKYVVINDNQSHFIGAIDAHDLHAALLPPNSYSWHFNYRWLTEILNSRGNAAELGSLPGFAGNESAISETTGNGEALNKMDRANVPWLSVVKDSRFLGIVERSHVASSIILDVVKQLGATGLE